MEQGHPRVVNFAPRDQIKRPITIPETPDTVRVAVFVEWTNGTTGDVVGRATAWCERAVMVDFADPWGYRRIEWFPAVEIRRL